MNEQNKKQQSSPDNQDAILEEKSRQLDEIERETDAEQATRQGALQGYSNRGPHTNTMDDQNDPDGYGPQDNFGDIDGQDPYTNVGSDHDNNQGIYSQNNDSVPAGENLYGSDEDRYGLDEPLAHEGDISRQGSNKTRHGTRISQDQQGNQQ